METVTRYATDPEAASCDRSLLQERCRYCALRRHCLPAGLHDNELDALDRIIRRPRPLDRGHHLYRDGDPLRSLYAVRAGAVKITTVDSVGDEHLLAFHLPGDLLGLDAISFGRHPSSAVTLETSSFCEIPFPDLEKLAQDIPALQRQLLRCMSREIVQEAEAPHLLARRTAEQRLAVALLGFSRRFRQRGLSPTCFRLPMSRRELGKFLGLAPETMSRLFRRFRDNRWIASAGREIRLQDMPALLELGGAADAARQRQSWTGKTDTMENRPGTRPS